VSKDKRGGHQPQPDDVERPAAGADRGSIPVRQLDPGKRSADDGGDDDQLAPAFCSCSAFVEAATEARRILAKAKRPNSVQKAMFAPGCS
jgi:hypothetical protein